MNSGTPVCPTTLPANYKAAAVQDFEKRKSQLTGNLRVWRRCTHGSIRAVLIHYYGVQFRACKHLTLFHTALILPRSLDCSATGRRIRLRLASSTLTMVFLPLLLSFCFRTTDRML